MRIWVTRTAPDDASTAARLRAMGHEPVCAPALEVLPVHSDVFEAQVDALAFTSRNGVRHHPFSPDLVDLPVFAVGDQTAEAARSGGYRDVRSAGGDVRRLQKLIVAELRSPASIMHFCAQETAGNLKGYLERFGHRIIRRVVYATVPSRSLGPLREDLSTIDAILVHSPRAAHEVRKAISRSGWHGAVWCISRACTAPLADLSGLEIRIAPRPKESALIDLVRQQISAPLARRPPLGLVGGSDLPGPYWSGPPATNDNPGMSRQSGYNDPDNDDDPPPAA